jgi:hypothetical protein
MNQTQLLELRDDLVRQFQSGATTDDIEEWADAYSFDRRDLVELVRLLLFPVDPVP